MATSKADAVKQMAETEGEQPAAKATETKAPETKAAEPAEVVDLGGDVQAVVLFDVYRVKHEGTWKDARKGQTIKVAEAVADRGEAIKGLRRV